MPQDGDFPFRWKRRQFPVRLSFSMTINKGQGQSLGKVGVYLSRDVFPHGQLYVPLSRVGRSNGLRVSLGMTNDGPKTNTANIVYK